MIRMSQLAYRSSLCLSSEIAACRLIPPSCPVRVPLTNSVPTRYHALGCSIARPPLCLPASSAASSLVARRAERFLHQPERRESGDHVEVARQLAGAATAIAVT